MPGRLGAFCRGLDVTLEFDPRTWQASGLYLLASVLEHFLALHGLSKLLETIDLAAERLNDSLKLSGVVLCMYDGGTRLAAEVGQDVDEFFQNARGQSTPWANAHIFQTRIRRNVRLAEAPSFGKSIFQYAPDSHGAEDYKQLAEEIRENEDR